MAMPKYTEFEEKILIPGGFEPPPWHHQFFTLANMLQSNLQELAALVTSIERLQLEIGIITNKKRSRRTPEEIRGELGTVIDLLAKLCSRLWLQSSGRQTERVKAWLLAESLDSIHPLLAQLLVRIEEDLGCRVFFCITPQMTSEFFESRPDGEIALKRYPALFGQSVATKFPDCQLEVEEATKCLVLNRNTAAVFHLMRVMEVGLKTTAKTLGIAFAPSWGAYLKKIAELVARKPKRRGIKWKRDESFYAGVAEHLHAVKLNTRNPTMHTDKSYDAETALSVYRSVRDFMRHLSTRR